MVVGESGLGKSTLVNSLFLSDLYNDRKILPIQDRVQKTVEIQKTTMEIEEKGILFHDTLWYMTQYRLTFFSVDTSQI